MWRTVTPKEILKNITDLDRESADILNSISDYQEKIDNLEELKKSILQKAFKEESWNNRLNH